MSYLPPIEEQSLGPVAARTKNFDLNLVNFDYVTWQNFEWENWAQVDALLNVAIGFLRLRGIWRADTTYEAGETVFDPQDQTKLYFCNVDHTSGTSFVTDIPLYWTLREDAAPLVESVFGRTGDIVAQSGDYPASLVPFDPTATTLDDVDVQSAIEQLDAWASQVPQLLSGSVAFPVLNATTTTVTNLTAGGNTFPTQTGAAGQFMRADGAGNIEFATPGGAAVYPVDIAKSLYFGSA